VRVGVDTYSYHRLLGLRRAGEPAAPARWDGWEPLVAEARRLAVDTLALQTMFHPDPVALGADALREAAGPLELVVSWGGAEGIRFGADAGAADDLDRWIAVAPAIGATLVRIVVGGPSLRRAEPARQRIRRTVPVLRRAAAAAAAFGVTLAVENHGDLTVPELTELLERVGRENVGVCLDVANVMRLGEDPIEGAGALAGSVRMVHLRDSDDPAGAEPVTGPRVRAYGEGVVPIETVLDVLAHAGFSGPVCVELAQLGEGDDEREIVAACVDWLRQRLGLRRPLTGGAAQLRLETLPEPISRPRRTLEMRAERLASGLGWPEGPTVLDDGRVVFVETYRSRIGVWSRESGVESFAVTGGGPNATALAADGSLYLTQNGGVVGPWRAEVQRPPSIQRVDEHNHVEIVATEINGIRFQAPNDLAFGPDGRLYFTDPGRFDSDLRPDPGYIFALNPDGSGELIADLGPTYPNGIVVEADGSVVWVESYARAVVRRRTDGSTETVCTLREGHVPDGLAVADDGRLFVTASAGGAIDVVSPDGSSVELLQVGIVPTNCAFAGSTLIVTDGGQTGTGDQADFGGVLWAVALDDTQGMAPFRGAIGSQAA